MTRHEWTMLAHTVNAQANAVLVKIMFPAGIMQGLFFDPAADPAINYGAIGVVMGHELSHVFDDQGSKFDEHGALNNWWTEADLTQFTAAAEALATQYDAYEPLPGAHINGHLTLGENIGDLAGLSLALDAYHTESRWPARSRARRLHRRPALLHVVRAGLPDLAARRIPAAAAGHRPPFARRVARRGGAQRRRVVRGIRHQAGDEDVPAA